MNHAQSTDLPTRPPLTLRVGITGKRGLSETQRIALGAKLKWLLEFVRTEVSRLADDPRAQAAYRTATTPDSAIALQFLSPLAEGADRLAAEVAVACGYTLHVPMPFAQDEYMQDFRAGAQRNKPDTTGQFRDLLPTDSGAVLALDGGREKAGDGSYDEARSYEAVGRYVVRNADLLIAIWDGAPPSGWGGTADIMRFALETGTPVWWIHTDPAADPKWLEQPQQMQPSGKTPIAEAALRVWLEQVILPPRLAHAAHQRSASEWIADVLQCIVRQEQPDPLATYLSKPLPNANPRPWYWKAHASLIRMAARYRFDSPPDKQPEDPIPRAWFELYKAADDRANEYGARYRSAYVWVFALGAVSLVCAAAALAFQDCRAVEWIAVLVEIGSLLMILLLIGANIRHDWHQRWIDYRLLAELCRKQQALAPLGWSLPGRAIETLADRADRQAGQHVPPDPDRTAWVAWLFAAYRRAAHLPSGGFDHGLVDRCRLMVRNDLVEAQCIYHEGRAKQYGRAGQFFVLFGEALFALVLLLVLRKLWLLTVEPDRHIWLTVLGFGASVAPTVAAASIGIRAYAELQVLARQSEHMRMAMLRLGKRLDDLGPVGPNQNLVSQDLGAITLDVATTMLQDVDGWARLFRVKVVEAG
jgi:hypothetical protein